jgi:hemerythrin-like metal-binding protein
VTTKILVIDDSNTQLLAVQRTLTENGFRVTTAVVNSVAEVLDLARIVSEEEPDLILVDVDLGLDNFDGSRLAHSLVRLKHAAGKTLDVILHSALDPAHLDKLAEKSGADAYLVKGRVKHLALRIRTLLTGLSSAARVEWSDAMSTGIDVLDEQHKVVIETLNNLGGAIAEGKARSRLRSTVVRLLDYVDDHFDEAEEELWRHDGPAARDSREGHRRFIADLKLFEDRLRREGTHNALAEDIYNHLNLWLVNHILRTLVRLRDRL